MSMTFIPYLNFDGTCAEAFRFYRSVLGGALVGGIRTHGRIAHRRLRTGTLTPA